MEGGVSNRDKGSRCTALGVTTAGPDELPTGEAAVKNDAGGRGNALRCGAGTEGSKFSLFKFDDEKLMLTAAEGRLRGGTRTGMGCGRMKPRESRADADEAISFSIFRI